MRFEDERYVRVYTRDTVTWKLLPWEARTLLLHLFRKVDRAGLLDVGDDGAEGIAALVDLPIEVVEAGMAKLIARKTAQWADDKRTLFLPNFYAAQEAHISDAQRKRDQRERAVARAKLGVATADDRSQNEEGQDSVSRGVTDGHDEGQKVTGGHEQSLRSDPIRAVKDPSAEASGDSEPEAEPEASPVNAKAFDVQNAAAQGEMSPELHAAAMRQKKLGKKRRPLYDAAVTGTALRLRGQYIAQRSRAQGQKRVDAEKACDAGEKHLRRAAEQVLEMGCTVERYLDVAFDTKPVKLSYPPLAYLAGPMMLEKVPAWIPPEEREPTGAAARAAAEAKAAYEAQQEALALADTLFPDAELDREIPTDGDDPFELDDEETA